MRNGRGLLVIIGAIIIFFFIGQFLFTPKAIVSFTVSDIATGPKAFFVNLFNRSTLLSQVDSLFIENESLKVQLLELRAQPTTLRQEENNFIVAEPFSQYPFSDVSKLVINAGANEGLQSGMTALAAPGIFLGVVDEVSEKTSTIKTIFSVGWELPVKIGGQRVDALLVGAHEPRLTLISKKKVIAGGESVLLVSRDFPLGLTVGTVEHVESKDEELFAEASITVPYAINELSKVYIQLP